jgi:peptidoglycan hydrolase-like protein with peptidoglycan-binding domain
MGSRGEQVTALQSFLESKGYLTMPAGVSKGYFGTLTKMALMKYQESSGVRATGYYGPITRGAMSKAMMKDTAGTMKKDGEMMDKKMQ